MYVIKRLSNVRTRVPPIVEIFFSFLLLLFDDWHPLGWNSKARIAAEIKFIYNILRYTRGWWGASNLILFLYCVCVCVWSNTIFALTHTYLFWYGWEETLLYLSWLNVLSNFGKKDLEDIHFKLTHTYWNWPASKMLRKKSFSIIFNTKK